MASASTAGEHRAEGECRDPEGVVPETSLHARVVKKLVLSCCSAGTALTIRKTAIAPRITKTSTPDAEREPAEHRVAAPGR